MNAAPATSPDALSAPFFEALAGGRLLIQRCAACGAAQLGQDRCINCRAEAPAWTPASGAGTVHAFTVVHTVFHPAFAGEVPYVAALVELEEGPRLYARLVDAPADQVRAGQPVRAAVVEITPGAFAPVFRPSEARACSS